MNSALNVEVYSDDPLVRQAASDVVSDALITAGFTEITVVNEDDLPPVDVPDNESALDYLKKINPAVFETPVTISAFSYPEEVEEETGPDDYREDAVPVED